MSCRSDCARRRRYALLRSHKAGRRRHVTQHSTAQQSLGVWGAVWQGGALYIAMAGQHQIWRHELRAGTTGAFSGDGYERNSNGRSGPATSWAQVRQFFAFWVRVGLSGPARASSC
jgi:hypothetical protein